MSATGRCLVIGVGNEFRSDDAVGIVAARQLVARSIPHCEIIESSGEGASLIHAFEDRNHVIIIDAVKSGQPAGTIHCLDASGKKIPSELLHFSSHSFGVAEAIELARALGQLPERLIVFGVEARTIAVGSGLSDEVTNAVDELIIRITEEITSKPAN